MRHLVHHIRGNNAGVIGTPAKYGFHVGDIVEITLGGVSRQMNIICHVDGKFFPMGWLGANWRELIEKNQMKVLHKYDTVTDEMYQKCKYKLGVKYEEDCLRAV